MPDLRIAQETTARPNTGLQLTLLRFAPYTTEPPRWVASGIALLRKDI